MHRRRLLAALATAPAFATSSGRTQSKLPLIGFISNRTPEQGTRLVEAMKRGLAEQGFVEGQTLAIDYQWSNGNLERLPALAESLVRRRVAVIVAGGTPQQARDATRTIPIVFTTGLDPVAYGLVGNIARPEANLTGATFYSGALGGKQLELLRELAPRTATIGLVVKPDSRSAAPQVEAIREVAMRAGIPLEIVPAATEQEFEPAIAAFAQGPGRARTGRGIIVSVDPYFDSRAAQLVAAIERHAVPAIYNLREFVDTGGLMSYGASILDTYRLAGVYAGRLLKGARPADLPVLLPTSFELVVNRDAARRLGLALPPSLLARADEIID